MTMIALSALIDELGAGVVVTDPEILASYRHDWARDPAAGTPLAVGSKYFRVGDDHASAELVDQCRQRAHRHEFLLGHGISFCGERNAATITSTDSSVVCWSVHTDTS